jgi:hypothetical protein
LSDTAASVVAAPVAAVFVDAVFVVAVFVDAVFVVAVFVDAARAGSADAVFVAAVFVDAARAAGFAAACVTRAFCRARRPDARCAGRDMRLAAAPRIGRDTLLALRLDARVVRRPAGTCTGVGRSSGLRPANSRTNALARARRAANFRTNAKRTVATRSALWRPAKLMAGTCGATHRWGHAPRD